MLTAGRIELIIGPMFAGKTTELMRRVKREIHACRSCFVIKYAKDIRYDSDNVASHDQMTLRARAAVTTLAGVEDRWKSYDVIAVDEGQFFPDIVEFCSEAAEKGKTVIVSALDGDYRRQPFGQICRLIPHCESVEKLTAVCVVCHTRQAAFTRRTVECAEQELIGGAETYIATCRECFTAEMTNKSEMARRKEAIKRTEEECLGHHKRTRNDSFERSVDTSAASGLSDSPSTPASPQAALSSGTI